MDEQFLVHSTTCTAFRAGAAKVPFIQYEGVTFEPGTQKVHSVHEPHLFLKEADFRAVAAKVRFMFFAGFALLACLKADTF